MTKSYADAIKTKKTKMASEIIKNKNKSRLSPGMLSKTLIKCKKGLKKSKKIQGKPPPKIFIIQAHSSECYLQDMDKKINDGTIQPIRYLEKAVKKFPKRKQQLQLDIEHLRDYNLDKLICHNFIDHQEERLGEYFCPETMEKTKGKKYLWCKECVHNTGLYNYIKFNTRINLETEFLGKKKVKILMTQSSGRKAFIKTGYNIIEDFHPKFKPLIHNLINTNINHTKSINKQIKHLDIITNDINKKYTRKFHEDKLDTNFRLYPRINTEKFTEKGKHKTKNRLIAGPINFNLEFNTNNDKDLKNGKDWPLGVYNLEDFNDPENNLFEFLFNDTEYKKRNFFNIIKSSRKVSGLHQQNKMGFRRGLLLQINALPISERNPDSMEDKKLLIDVLNLGKGFKANPLDNDRKQNVSINRYNKYLYDNLFDKNKKFKTRVSLREVIDNILIYEGYYGSNWGGPQTPEIIFIVNQCRSARLTNDNIPFAEPSYNQTQNPRTRNFFRARREDSDEAR